MTVRSRTVTAVAALTLTLGVAACGADEKPEAAGSSTSPSASPSATTSTTTAAPTSPATSKPGDGGGAHLSTASFLPAMKGAMADKKSLRTTMEMTVNGQTSKMTGVQRMGSKPALAVDMTGAAFGGKGRIVVVNEIVYVSMRGATPEGKYFKLDPKNKQDPMARQMATMVESMDPTKTFDAFDAGLRSVKHAGSEKIDGTKVDQYKVTVDTAKALRAQGQKMPAGMPKTITYDIWMDKDDLIRRVSFSLAGTSMVMNTSDWGKPVTIKAPSASQIVAH